MYKFRILTIVLGIIFSTSACSTLQTNYLDKKSQLGNYYSGTKLNLTCWKCYGRAVAKDAGLLILAPITVPILLADLPLSMVGDTLHIPIDASIKASHPPINVREEECIY